MWTILKIFIEFVIILLLFLAAKPMECQCPDLELSPHPCTGMSSLNLQIARRGPDFIFKQFILKNVTTNEVPILKITWFNLFFKSLKQEQHLSQNRPTFLKLYVAFNSQFPQSSYENDQKEVHCCTDAASFSDVCTCGVNY